MNNPIRIQRKRTKGWRKPPNTVYVGRGTKWGNPYRGGLFYPHPRRGDMIPARDNHHARWLFAVWLNHTPEGRQLMRDAKVELRGKHLACWCALNQPCHADILLAIANDGDEHG